MLRSVLLSTVLTLLLSSCTAAATTIASITTSGRPESKPVAVFIGDSYTAGAGGGKDGTARWSTLVAKSIGWKEANLGRGGTGFHATAGKVGCNLDYCPSYGEMVPAAVAARPDIVIVSGGRNDGSVFTDQIDTLFADLRHGLSEAKIFAVAPLWGADPTPEWIGRQASAVDLAVTANGGTFLDVGQPLADKPNLMSIDAIHPNVEGHAAIANAVLASIDR